MTAQPVAVGDRTIDYSGARPSPAATYKAGGRAIHRYSAGAGNSQAATQWKLCGKGEIAAAVKAGMDFIANCEWYESRVTEGASAGAADGRADLAFWKSRGLARGATIYVSWDAAPVRGKWGAVDAYLRGYGRALGGYYRVGAYAGTPYLRHAFAAKVITHGWRPNAGSWSNDGLPYQPDTSTAAKRAALVARALKATPAAILQTGSYWWSKSADENLILRPCGSHLQAIAAATKPAKPTAPAKPSAPVQLYPRPSGRAADLGSVDQHFTAFLDNQGRIVVHKDHKPFRVI